MLEAFESNSDISWHYRAHTGVKHFTCQSCEKKFERNSHLLQHQAIHSKVRYFKCFICLKGRFSKTKHQLKMHMKKYRSYIMKKSLQCCCLHGWVSEWHSDKMTRCVTLARRVSLTQRQNDTVRHFSTATKWHCVLLISYYFY